MQENGINLRGDRARKLIYSVLLLGLIVGLISIPRFVGAAFSRGDEFIPIPLHAAALADYGADGLYLWRYSADSSLMESAIRDRDPRATDASDRALQVVRGFDTPVPTVTPLSLWSVATEAGAPQPTQQFAPTSTADVTETPGPSPTATLTFTPGPSPTATATPTQGPSPTSTDTSTPEPIPSGTTVTSPAPTSTPEWTATTVPLATDTPVSTETWTPTSTATVPPTPTEDFCASLILGGFTVDNDKVMWDVTNNSAVSIKIVEIFLDWPSEGIKLKKVRFEGREIWDDDDDEPPTIINSNWQGNNDDRQVESGNKKELKFEFEKEPGSSGYNLEISFDVGCTLVW